MPNYELMSPLSIEGAMLDDSIFISFSGTGQSAPDNERIQIYSPQSFAEEKNQQHHPNSLTASSILCGSFQDFCTPYSPSYEKKQPKPKKGSLQRQNFVYLPKHECNEALDLKSSRKEEGTGIQAPHNRKLDLNNEFNVLNSQGSLSPDETILAGNMGLRPVDPYDEKDATTARTLSSFLDTVSSDEIPNAVGSMISVNDCDSCKYNPSSPHVHMQSFEEVKTKHVANWSTPPPSSFFNNSGPTSNCDSDVKCNFVESADEVFSRRGRSRPEEFSTDEDHIDEVYCDPSPKGHDAYYVSDEKSNFMESADEVGGRSGSEDFSTDEDDINEVLPRGGRSGSKNFSTGEVNIDGQIYIDPSPKGYDSYNVPDEKSNFVESADEVFPRGGRSGPENFSTDEDDIDEVYCDPSPNGHVSEASIAVLTTYGSTLSENSNIRNDASTEKCTESPFKTRNFGKLKRSLSTETRTTSADGTDRSDRNSSGSRHVDLSGLEHPSHLMYRHLESLRSLNAQEISNIDKNNLKRDIALTNECSKSRSSTGSTKLDLNISYESVPGERIEMTLCTSEPWESEKSEPCVGDQRSENLTNEVSVHHCSAGDSDSIATELCDIVLNTDDNTSGKFSLKLVPKEPELTPRGGVRKFNISSVLLNEIKGLVTPSTSISSFREEIVQNIERSTKTTSRYSRKPPRTVRYQDASAVRHESTSLKLHKGIKKEKKKKWSFLSQKKKYGSKRKGKKKSSPGILD